MTLQEIAERISVHLKRFEKDPEISAGKYGARYYLAGAYCPKGGRRVRVTYVSYQPTKVMTRAEAEKYLAWLDAGNVGTHYGMERE